MSLRGSRSRAIASVSGAVAFVFLGLGGCGSGTSAPAADAVDTGVADAADAADTFEPSDSAGLDVDALDDAPDTPDTNDTPDTPDTIGPNELVLGGARPARVLLPKDRGDGPLPAIFLLGGYDYFARDLDDWVGLSDRVDQDRFALVLPDGLVDEDGSPFWNATDTCCDFYGVGVDDVAYLTGLMDELAAAIPVSGVGLVGHSAGGFMAYRMACEVPQRLGGVISVAGSGFLDERDCAVRDVPLSVLQVHGDLDDVMPFDGDADAPGALEMLARWADIDGCKARGWDLETAAEARLAYAEEGVTRVGEYGTCASGEDVRLWLLEGSDHYPSFTPDFVADALGWLLPRLR